MYTMYMYIHVYMYNNNVPAPVCVFYVNPSPTTNVHMLHLSEHLLTICLWNVENGDDVFLTCHLSHDCVCVCVCVCE